MAIADYTRVEDRFTLSQRDFDRFAALSGDDNPIHTDPAFAADTVFGATVSHGMLLFTRVRGALARHYPNAALSHQTLMFPHPAYADEPLVLQLTPEDSARDRVVLNAVIRKPDGTACLEGRCELVEMTDREALS